MVSSDATVSCSYDDRGLLTAADSDSGDDYAYEWDYHGRLTEVSVNGEEELGVKYGPFGRIVEVEDGNGIRKLVRDGDDVLWRCDSSWNKSRAYVNHPMTGLPLMWEEYSLVGEAQAVPYYVSIGGTDRVRAIVDGSQTLLTKYDYDALAKPTQTFVSGAVSVPSITRDYLFDSEVGLLRDYLFDSEVGLLLSGALNVIDTGLGRYLPKMGEVRRGLHAATMGSDFNPTFGQTQDKTSYWSPVAGSMLFDPSIGPYLKRNAYHPFWKDDAEKHFSHRGPGGHGGRPVGPGGHGGGGTTCVDLLSKWNTSGQLQAMFHGCLSGVWLDDIYRDQGYDLPDDQNILDPNIQTEDFYLYVHPIPAPPRPCLRRVVNWQQLTGDEVGIILYKHIAREADMGSWVEAGQTVAHTRRHLTVPEFYFEPHVHMECEDWNSNTYTLFDVSRFYQTYPIYAEGGWEQNGNSEEQYFKGKTVPALRSHGWGQGGRVYTDDDPRLSWEWEARGWQGEEDDCYMFGQGWPDDYPPISCFGEGARQCYEWGYDWPRGEDGGRCYCMEDREFWYIMHGANEDDVLDLLWADACWSLTDKPAPLPNRFIIPSLEWGLNEVGF